MTHSGKSRLHRSARFIQAVCPVLLWLGVGIGVGIGSGGCKGCDGEGQRLAGELRQLRKRMEASKQEVSAVRRQHWAQTARITKLRDVHTKQRQAHFKAKTAYDWQRTLNCVLLVNAELIPERLTEAQKQKLSKVRAKLAEFQKEVSRHKRALVATRRHLVRLRREETEAENKMYKLISGQRRFYKELRAFDKRVKARYK